MKIPLPKIYVIFFLCLLLPALLINLGLFSFIEDEGTRGVVSQEMILSGDYITPTISGELYFNKPPFYNWFIVMSFKLFGNFSKFALRFPNVLFLLYFAGIVWLLTRKYFSREFAFILSLFIITNGRIFFYDSLFGLIDIAYSSLVFTMFFGIYVLYEKGKYTALFILAYSLMAAGFLMKGLPAIAFLGISLLTLFIYKKNFRKLFSIAHATGFLAFAIIVGTYYFLYIQKNPGMLDTIFQVLFTETSKKTVTGNEIYKTIGHFFVFPIEVLGHFMPWTFLVILLVKRKNRQVLLSNPIIRYSLWLLLFNILIFWISPVVYPRYLLMFLPLMYIGLLYVYLEQHEEKNTLNRIIHGLFHFIVWGSAIMPVAYLFIPDTRVVNGALWKMSLLLLLSAFLCYVYIKYRKHMLLNAILAIIIFRIGFNVFILPARTIPQVKEVQAELSARKIGQLLKDKEKVFIYDVPSLNHEGGKDLYDFTVYYLTSEMNRIIPYDTTFIPGAYYIIRPIYMDKVPPTHEKTDTLYMETNYTFNVLKIEDSK